MAAPYSDLQSKAEAALKTLLETISASNRGNADVLAGLGTETLEGTRIEATADAGEEDPPHTGNFWLTFTVTIRSNDGLSAHRSRVKYVIDTIMVDTLAATLTSNATDFTCQGIRSRRLLPQTAEDRTLITQIQFDGICCPSDFA
jgi:hypothetical protein